MLKLKNKLFKKDTYTCFSTEVLLRIISKYFPGQGLFAKLKSTNVNKHKKLSGVTRKIRQFKLPVHVNGRIGVK